MLGRDRASDDLEEMVFAWREGWLVVEPRERADEREEIRACEIRTSDVSGLCAHEEPRSRRLQREARRMERRRADQIKNGPRSGT